MVLARRRMNSIPQSFAFSTILSKSEVTSSVSWGIDGMSFTQMAAASFVTCYNAKYSVSLQRAWSSTTAYQWKNLVFSWKVLPMLHFIARNSLESPRKFAQMKGLIVLEVHRWSLSWRTVRRLVQSYLIQINRSCDIAVSNMLLIILYRSSFRICC